jgi:transketolase
MRKTCLRMVHELARTDPRIVFVGSDLGPGTLDGFRREMPERFFMEGVSEANAVGMAAGMALEGKIVYLNTIATFLTRRAYEQIVLDLCLHRANVRLIGNGGGLVYAPLGPTHMVVEDIAALRAVPGMTICCPADAREMEKLMPATVDHPGPVYIRLGKGYDPIVTPEDGDFAIGRAVPVAEGRDCLLVCTGVALHPALAARDILGEQGVDAAVLHMPTVKPLDLDALAARVAGAPAVVSVEEHVVSGGLGSAVAEFLAERGGALPRFRRVGIPDAFPDRYGSQAQLMERFGITGPAIARTVLELLGR